MANKLDLCAFGAELVVEGTVALPKLLLHNYSRLGLQEGEFILILQLIGLRDRKPFPTPDELGKLMGIGTDRVESMLGRLMEEKILSMDKVYDSLSEQLVPAYSIQGLIERLADIWAMEKAKQLASAKQVVKNQTLNTDKLGDGTATLIKAFEKEFGRPLTEIECSNILEWQSSFSQELILEALKRAVLNQIPSWRYIHSILREWDRKNLRTLQEINADDARYQAKQNQAKTGKPRVPGGKGTDLKDKYKDFYL